MSREFQSHWAITDKALSQIPRFVNRRDLEKAPHLQIMKAIEKSVRGDGPSDNLDPHSLGLSMLK